MKCDLCDCAKFRTRKGTIRDNPSLQILECESCGLVMLSSLEHIKKQHYENSGMHEENILPIDQWPQETEIDDQRRLDSIRSMLPNRRLLDFGCGAGGFILKAQPHAKKVAGVELETHVQNSRLVKPRMIKSTSANECAWIKKPSGVLMAMDFLVSVTALDFFATVTVVGF